MPNPKIPSEGPLFQANVAKLMKEGIPQRKAVSMAGLRGDGGSKVKIK